MTTARARLLPMLFCLAALAACGGGDLGPGCPTSDPEPPDVSGVWAVSEPEILTSSCAQNVNQQVLSLIVGPTGTCNYDVDQDVNDVTADECHGETLFGCVDGQGVISAPINLALPGSCTLFANGNLLANAGTATSTARYTLAVTFSGSGCGVLTDCQATVQTSWER